MNLSGDFPLSKSLLKERLHIQLSQNKYSKSDLIEQIINLLPSKDKDKLIELILDLSNNDELEELMEKVNPGRGYRIL